MDKEELLSFLRSKHSVFELTEHIAVFNMREVANIELPYPDDDDKNVFIATGYNTWGMTNGTIAGKIIYDLVRNCNNKYTDIFNSIIGNTIFIRAICVKISTNI